jgi:hypothetical protein
VCYLEGTFSLLDLVASQVVDNSTCGYFVHLYCIPSFYISFCSAEEEDISSIVYMLSLFCFVDVNIFL